MFTQEEIDRVRGPLMSTWQKIGPYAMASSEIKRNADAIGICLEICLDADRILIFAGDSEAVKIVKQNILKHGWVKTIDQLSEAIQMF